jgi:hypothetical protein
MSYIARFNEKVCLQLWDGEALRTLHVSIMFLKLPPKTLGFHGGYSVGQVQSLKSRGQNPSRSFRVSRKRRRRKIYKKSGRGVREECENSREIVKRKGVLMFFGEI